MHVTVATSICQVRTKPICRVVNMQMRKLSHERRLMTKAVLIEVDTSFCWIDSLYFCSLIFIKLIGVKVVAHVLFRFLKQRWIVTIL